MVLKKGDFVELDFVGKVAATGQVFDSTLEKKEPIVVPIGAGMILKALDSALIDKEVGQEFELELKPEDAFGQRNPSLVQLTSINTFRQHNVNPVPGLQVNLDGVLATIRSVTGGRVIIDFNHPLAGKALKFWVKINKLVTGVEDKIKALCEWKPSIKVKEKEIEISVENKLPEKVAELKAQQLKALIPEIKDKEIKFAAHKEEKIKEEKKAK